MKLPHIYQKLALMIRAKSDGITELDIPEIQKEIASEFRTSKEDVRQAMKELEKYGVLKCKNKASILLKRE